MSKHKERWRETELQLRDTRENLERVDGIRRELEKRISELEESETSQPQTFETSEPRQSPAGTLHAVPTQPTPATGTRESAMSETGPLRLTIDQVPFPAYMLNYNLELTWYNEEARVLLLGSFDRLPANTKERGVFEFFSRGTYGKSLGNCEAFRQLHNQMGRKRVAAALGNASMDVTGRVPGVSGSDASPIAELPLNLRTVDGDDEYYRILVSYFREGILVIFTDEEAGHHGLLGLLERRDEVIRNLLKKRLPVLTDVAVMVADLQNSVRICSELPPEEYFELINQIWSTMEPIFRNYYGTHGKHVGDGMMYYFFPQPDCNYIFNAVRCTSEMREAMRKISKEWQLRKNWLNELYLNTGLNEGQEWLGVFHVETKVEFSVLGDTINHAARLSDFARHGSIWATKNLLGKLTSEERKRVRFGVKRQDLEGREVFVNASYSRLSELVDLASPRYEKLCDIAALAVTEIVEVE